MATTTPNIGLTKPIGTEKYDLAVVNTNSDIIDTEITDAKAGSNLRIFKVKNDLAHQDNAVSRIAGDGRYVGKEGDEIVNGLKTFPIYPRMSALTPPSLDNELVSKKYVDDNILPNAIAYSGDMDILKTNGLYHILRQISL